MLRADTLLWVCLALTAIALPMTTRAAEYEDWYQVEFIVFAQNSPRATDEAWALRELSYPDDMLAVDDTPAPYLLSQVTGLRQYEALVSGDATEAPASTSDFLFESQSRLSAREQLEAQLEALRQREAAAKAALEEATNTNREDSEADTADTEAEALATTTDPVDIAELLTLEGTQSFASVPAGERFLRSVAGSLNRSSSYRVLAHKAWRQPILEGEAWPVLVQAGEQYGDRYELDGTLTFRRSRFLHVDTDLWFTRFSESEVAPVGALPEGITQADARDFPELVAAARDATRFIPVHTHQMSTSRRMRREELHYLDHPYFGVIVRIERYDGND